MHLTMEAETSAYTVLTETVINYAAHTPVIYVYIALYVKKYGLYSPVFNLHFHNTKYKRRYICALGQR